MRMWWRLTLAAALCLAATGLTARDDAQTWSMLEKVTAEKYAGTDSVVVLDETKVEVEPSGLSHVYKTRLVKVLTEAGAMDLSTLRFDYDPASSYAEIRGLTVFRSDKRVEKVPEARVLDLPQPQEMIYWGPRMKLASVPKLHPGDAVEISTYSKGFVIAYLANGGDDEKYIPPMRGHYYDVVLFQGDQPIVKKTYTIVLPKDKPLRAEVYNGELGSSAQFDDQKLTYSWWKENVPTIKREPRMVEDTDAMPKLVLATVKDWPEKSRWFYKVNEDAKAFAWNDAIKAKVEEITKGLKTDEEKRMAILAWVARQIRYSGISMGKGEGYTLHPGIMTFEDRAGVCKDIAGMCVTMFRAAGYTTYPAMTMAGAKVENLPADQFNHCVVAVETGKDTYTMYDPTWCPFSAEYWSSAEKPQNYVIGSPRGEELMETPAAPPSDNFIKVTSTGTISESGDLTGAMAITGGHYSETNLRWAIVNSPAPELKATFEQWLRRISPEAELVSFETTDATNVHAPLKITLRYRVPGYAVVAGKEMFLIPPAAKNILSNRRLTDFAQAAATEKRAYDIFLRATREFTFEETLAVPKGYRMKASPEAKKVDGPAAAFEADLSMKGESLVLRERFTVKKKIVPVVDYANLKEAVDAMKAFGDGLSVLAK
jgi:transglutaminase-like putative cysteine protease